jgi:Immunity protein 70
LGLYLCVFAARDKDEELDGVEVGSYEDFHALRQTVAEQLEQGNWGSRFPLLMTHPDSDGEWSEREAFTLADELRTIEEEFSRLPPRSFAEGSWQNTVAKATGGSPQSLSDSFITVNGEALIGRLRQLAEKSAEVGCPISFQ